MKKKTMYLSIAAVALSVTIVSCGGSETPATEEVTEEITEAVEEVAEEVTEEATEEASGISGEELFTSSGCVACHQPETKTVGPAINEIAKAYADNADGLTAFLNGEGEAIVDPAQAAVMAPQVEITKKMSDEEKTAIAEYILAN